MSTQKDNQPLVTAALGQLSGSSRVVGAKQIRKALLEQVVVGVTLLNVETGYDGLDQKAVLSVVYARKYPEIRETALSIDPKAFIVTSDVTNVNGKGYTLHRYDGTPL